MEKVQIKVVYDTSDAEKKTKDLTGNTNTLSDSLDKVTNGAVTGFKNMVKGVKTLTGGFKGLRGAVIATGLGGLLVIVTAVVEYFQNFDAAIKIVQQTIDGFAGGVSQLAKALSFFIEGEFGKAADAFLQVGNAAKDAADASGELYDITIQLQELQSKNIVQNAKLTQSLELQKRILEDTTLTEQERLKALDEVTRLSEEIQKNAIEENKLREKELSQKILLEKNDITRRELKKELAQVTADLINQEGALNIIRKDAQKVEREIIALTRQRREEQQQLFNETVEIVNKLDEEAKKRQELLEDAMTFDDSLLSDETELYKDELDEQTAAYKNALEEQVKIAQSTGQAKIQIQNAVNDSLVAAVNLVGAATKEGKAFAIAQVLFSEGRALAQALANSQSPTPDNLATGGLAGIAKFATISASILKTVAKVKNIISSAPGAGGASFGGGGNLGQLAGAQPTPTQFNTPQQIVDLLGADALRAYVVTGDINNSIDAENQLNNLSTI